MKTHHLPARSGFTLLEVLLATTISIMLLGAVYVAYDLALKGTTAGRDLVASSDLSRGVVNRMSVDFAGTLGPLPPKSGGGNTDSSSSSSSSTSSGSSSITGSSTTSGGTSSSGTSSSSSSSSSSGSSDTVTSDAMSTVAANVPLQAGIVGTNTQLSLFVARVPPWLTTRDADASAQAAPDLRRVTYYISSSGRGLCRQERAWVTADGVQNSADPDRSTENEDLIAPEVTSISFEYASGSGWISEWDGSQAGLDGSSTQGPPRAIRVTLTMEMIDNEGQPQSRQIAHVFPIRAAVGLTQTSSGTTSGAP